MDFSAFAPQHERRDGLILYLQPAVSNPLFARLALLLDAVRELSHCHQDENHAARYPVHATICSFFKDEKDESSMGADANWRITKALQRLDRSIRLVDHISCDTRHGGMFLDVRSPLLSAWLEREARGTDSDSLGGMFPNLSEKARNLHVSVAYGFTVLPDYYRSASFAALIRACEDKQADNGEWELRFWENRGWKWRCLKTRPIKPQ